MNKVVLDILENAAKIFCVSAVGLGTGTLHGILFKTHILLSAKVFAIAAIVVYVFELANYELISINNQNPKPRAYYLIELLGDGTLLAIHIVVMRRLNLISNPGTVIYSAVAGYLFVKNLVNLVLEELKHEGIRFKAVEIGEIDYLFVGTGFDRYKRALKKFVDSEHEEELIFDFEEEDIVAAS